MTDPSCCPACAHPLESDGLPICPACGVMPEAAQQPPLPAVNESAVFPKARRIPLRREETADERDPPRRKRPAARRPRGPEPMHPAAIASVIFGGIGCLTACLWPVSLCCVVPGLICAAVARTTASRRTAAAGFALSAAAGFAAAGFMVVSIVSMTVGDVDTGKSAQPKVPSFFR